MRYSSVAKANHAFKIMSQDNGVTVGGIVVVPLGGNIEVVPLLTNWYVRQLRKIYHNLTDEHRAGVVVQNSRADG